MTRGVAVLRPEPGNAATAARAEAAGYAALRLPLFAVVPLAWTVPDPRDHDAMVLTSANTVRHAGAGLEVLAGLPVITVGEQTAAAARAAGLAVIAVGTSDADALANVLTQHGVHRVLHLGGRDHAAVTGVARAIAVYASEPVPIEAAALHALPGRVALLHSTRAAQRLGTLLANADVPRRDIAVAAFSPAIAAATGAGWQAVATAALPSDAALFAAIAALGR